jgi:hypothetical protein
MNQMIMVNLKQNCIEFFDTSQNTIGEKNPSQAENESHISESFFTCVGFVQIDQITKVET